MTRREELLAGCTDHVLEHGLIGLSLRPLAAAVGTSDRMLIYHFGTRDRLVAAIVAEAIDRSVTAVRALDPRDDAVRRLWSAVRRQPMRGCSHVYLQAAATGLLGEEPHRTAVRRANERWTEALTDYLGRAGVETGALDRVTRLVDAALQGLQLDPTGTARERMCVVDDVADLVAGTIRPRG